MSELYSIGEAAKLTGLSVLRIRAWENRYGEPGGIVENSTHRRYTMTQIQRLRVLAALVEMGYRIGGLTQHSDAVLANLLEQNLLNPETTQSSLQNLWNWRKAVHDSDPQAMNQFLNEKYTSTELIEFLENWLSPILHELGNWWASGEISVTQEHIASEVLESFLSQKRLCMNTNANAPAILFANLPLEQHTLGLQMCALLAVSEGYRVFYAGRRLPRSEMISSAQIHQVKALCLSFSISVDDAFVTQEMKALRKELAPTIELWCGGAGAPHHLKETSRFSSLKDYHQKLRSLV